MGKVIINEHDTAQTASKNSSSKSPHQQMNQKNQSSTSQFGDIADNIGVKMSNKTKGATSQKIAVHDNKGDEKASTADTAKAKAKPVAHVNGKAVFGLPAGSAAAAKTGNKKIITQAKIVERTQVKVANHQPKTGAKAAEALDPELALLANRTSAAEKPRVDMFRSGGKSISGMVGDPVRHTVRPSNSSAQATKSQPTPASSSEENLRFTKFKSILIGVGVALVVAVVGFACINLFGGGKNMCTVLFESNGGSKVAGTEIVCGRTDRKSVV